MKLEEIKRIGPKTISLLNKLKIKDTNDLVKYYPFRYNIIKKSNLKEAENNSYVTIDGKVETKPVYYRIKKNLDKLSFKMNTGTYLVNILIFNRGFMRTIIKEGSKITIIGKYDKIHNQITATEIKMESIGDKTIIEPVYHLTYGLSKKVLQKYINISLQDFDTIEYVPNYLKEKYNLINKKEAIKIVHNPNSIENLKKALQYLKYEELLVFMIKMNYLKTNKQFKIGLKRNIEYEEVNKFINNLPFKLTPDQLKAVNEIYEDLNSPRRMNRLLQGDVGSGKTLVAIIAIYINYLSGYQSALMVPTEILARQHYETIKKLFEKYNINICLITSKIKAKEKKEYYKGLEEGTISVAIGTHALISEKLKYHNLGLVITDEQHRFGVNQRSELKNKGITPDTLYMSATPIPRTYALTIYGDTDVSPIKSKPKGRKEIVTVFKKEKDITDVLEMMKKELELNHQIYVVAPMIDTESDSEKESVYDLEEKMNKAFGKISKIGIIHGKLDPKDKDKVMKDFEKNKINILISTTVIEVGVNVPNASMIVIFNANMFGLSTLHQLRGRVGRGDTQSYCVLVAKESEERLRFLENTSDGFEISEYDFQTRGEGDLFGTRQSGELGLKMANIKRDFKMLLKAKEDADEFINMLLTFETNPEFGPILEELKKVDTLD